MTMKKQPNEKWMNEGRKKIYKSLDRVACKLSTGSDLKGLSVAGGVQKELGESEVAKREMGRDLQRSLLSLLSSFFMLTRICFLLD